MNMFKRITSYIKWRLRRRKYIKLAKANNSMDFATDFAIVHSALQDCIDDYEDDRLSQPQNGICFNAGFMGYGAEYKKVCRLFLEMCAEFNLQRAAPIGFGNFAWPFADVDAASTATTPWTAQRAVIRLEAMYWIMGEIDRYELTVK